MIPAPGRLTSRLQKISSLLLSALLVILLLSGCAPMLVGAGAAGGAAGYAYVQGELVREYPVPLDPVWDASVATLKDFNVIITSMKRDRLGGRIAGRRADETPVEMVLESRAPRVTAVRIRVGVLGDRTMSERLEQGIVARLQNR